MPGKSHGKKQPARQKRGGRSGGGPSNVPTVVANPQKKLVLHLVDETADGVPFTGGLTYKHLMAAVARQSKSHLPTPLTLTAEEVTQWYDKFAAVYSYLRIDWAQAWGTPFVDTDKGSSTRFSFSLFPNDTAALPPPPFVTDSASGASDRPFGRRRGGPMFFGDSGNNGHQAAYLTSADITHFHVTIW